MTMNSLPYELRHPQIPDPELSSGIYPDKTVAGRLALAEHKHQRNIEANISDEDGDQYSDIASNVESRSSQYGWSSRQGGNRVIKPYSPRSRVLNDDQSHQGTDTDLSCSDTDTSFITESSDCTILLGPVSSYAEPLTAPHVGPSFDPRMSTEHHISMENPFSSRTPPPYEERFHYRAGSEASQLSNAFTVRPESSISVRGEPDFNERLKAAEALMKMRYDSSQGKSLDSNQTDPRKRIRS